MKIKSEVELAFEVMAEANIFERVIHCLKYLFDPSYMLRRWKVWEKQQKD